MSSLQIPKYKVIRMSADIEMEDFTDKYVDVDTFVECCKECHNYDVKWSCPPYDFDVMDYWHKYKRIKIFGKRIVFEKDTVARSYTPEEIKIILKEVLSKEKDYLTLELWEEEKRYNGSISLSAGSCSICGENNCSKPDGEPCLHKDQMRYSIEALGGDVGKICTDLLGEELQWMEEDKLPDYFVLVCALLYN